jgi:hypothetical protein
VAAKSVSIKQRRRHCGQSTSKSVEQAKACGRRDAYVLYNSGCEPSDK